MSDDRDDRLAARLTLNATLEAMRDELVKLRGQVAENNAELRVIRAEASTRAALTPPPPAAPPPPHQLVGAVSSGHPYRDPAVAAAGGESPSGEALARAETTAIARAPAPRLSLFVALATLAGAAGHALHYVPQFLELLRLLLLPHP